MNSVDSPQEPPKPKLASKPAPYENVIVVGPHFRCLGYVDRRGIWRSTCTRQMLRGVLEWQRF
jgi:hypothetical protein